MSDKTKMRRDTAHRGQPSLLDPLPADEGKQSRDETYRDVKTTFPNCKEMWLARIIAAGPNGITAYELAEKYKTPQNVFSGRITALAEERRVVRTAARRKTKTSDASVIVAAEFLFDRDVNRELDEQSQPAQRRGLRRSNQADDTMPDALTNPKAQRDINGDLLVSDAEYAIFYHGKLVAGRVRVFEDDLGTVYAVRIGSATAQPERIDEMEKGMRWERLK